MSEYEPEFPTVMSGRWVGADFAGLPRASVVQMQADDARAVREVSEMAARAEDAREAVAVRCRQEGRDTSFAACLQRAARGMAATDYRDGREAEAARMTDAGHLRDRPRRLTDNDLHAGAMRAELRQLERRAEADRAERDRLLEQARARHPVSAAWPSWVRS